MSLNVLNLPFFHITQLLSIFTFLSRLFYFLHLAVSHQVWANGLMSDDLIGKAKVDIEDRHFTSSWWDKSVDELKWRPKEWLPLWSPDSALPQVTNSGNN